MCTDHAKHSCDNSVTIFGTDVPQVKQRKMIVGCWTKLNNIAGEMNEIVCVAVCDCLLPPRYRPIKQCYPRIIPGSDGYSNLGVGVELYILQPRVTSSLLGRGGGGGGGKELIAVQVGSIYSVPFLDSQLLPSVLSHLVCCVLFVS